MHNKKREKENIEAISLRKTIILLIITAVILMGYVWTRLKAVELSYTYSKLSQEERKLLEENDKLRLQIASLKAPGHLTRLATSEHQLFKPSGENQIYIKLEYPK